MRHDCLRMDGYQVSMTGGLATMISSPATSADGGGLATVEGTGNNTLPGPGHCKSTRLDTRQTNPQNGASRDSGQSINYIVHLRGANELAMFKAVQELRQRGRCQLKKWGIVTRVTVQSKQSLSNKTRRLGTGIYLLPATAGTRQSVCRSRLD